MNTFDPPLHVLLVEAYPGPSHRRVNELLERHSRHRIKVVEVGRDHWKVLALLGHVELADRILASASGAKPDVLILSGTMNVPGLLSLLPHALSELPRIVYFHESQWTYPTFDKDTRPYLVQHLDAVMAASEVWFNSRYHRDSFWAAALAPGIDDRIRSLAARLSDRVSPITHVVYPPVALDTIPPLPACTHDEPRIVWNARWEHDKRPDRFVDAIRKLNAAGCSPFVHILGTGGRPPAEIEKQLAGTAAEVRVPGYLERRRDYEAELSGSGLITSTADHEFFGIGVLESVLAGNVPVVPAALAYPETLPSAWFYGHGDLDDLARTVRSAIECGDILHRMHAADAGRFLPEHTVPAWDEGIARVWRNRASDR